MVKPRIAAGTAIAVTSSKPASTAIREAMERAVHQAIQEGRDIDPVYLKAKIVAVGKETWEAYGGMLAEIETRVRAQYQGSDPRLPEIHEAIGYSARACATAGLIDEDEIERRLFDAAERAALG